MLPNPLGLQDPNLLKCGVPTLSLSCSARALAIECDQKNGKLPFSGPWVNSKSSWPVWRGSVARAPVAVAKKAAEEGEALPAPVGPTLLLAVLPTILLKLDRFILSTIPRPAGGDEEDGGGGCCGGCRI